MLDNIIPVDMFFERNRCFHEEACPDTIRDFIPRVHGIGEELDEICLEELFSETTNFILNIIIPYVLA